MFCSGRDAFTYAPAREPAQASRLLHPRPRQDLWETPADDALVPAASAMYVYGHGREGVMGDEPVAFTEKSRADAFIAKWGGQVYKYEEITLKRLD
ncbi:MAG: nitrous oxide reductase accessory protein NosL [Sutterella wadsworthensis]